MTNIALIGASNNSDKFGNKILLNLISRGFKVFPINPKADYIENIKVFKNISELNKNIDIFNFVVPAEITLNILRQNVTLLRNKKIWCQPGSSDSKVEEFLLQNNFTNYVTESCIMINKI